MELLELVVIPNRCRGQGGKRAADPRRVKVGTIPAGETVFPLRVRIFIIPVHFVTVLTEDQGVQADNIFY